MPDTAKPLSEIASLLSSEYHDFNHYNKNDPLEELIFIVLSLLTQEAVYLRTHKNLFSLVDSPLSLARLSNTKIAQAISSGGLSVHKAERIKHIATRFLHEPGSDCTSSLGKMDDNDCEAYLLSLPGVGKKTARCVMMYSLERTVFPVDTHCFRIAKRLGLIDPDTKSVTNNIMDSLQEIIPAPYRYSLHVNMVSLGRSVCTPKKPRCGKCVIRKYCDYAAIMD